MMQRNRRLSRISRAVFLSVAMFGVSLGAPALTPDAVAAVPELGKIAVIDMQRILNETAAGKKARKDLEASSLAKQKKLDKRRKKLEDDQAKLNTLKGEALMAAQEKLQRDLYELQSMYMTLQQELAEQEAKLLEKIYTNSQGIAKELAKQNGVDLILIRDETTVLYTKDSLDLTGDLIKAYNKKF